MIPIAARTGATPWRAALLLAASMFLVTGSRLVLLVMQPLVSLWSRSGTHGSLPGAELVSLIGALVVAPALVIAFGRLSRRFNRSQLTGILTVFYAAGLVSTYAVAEAGIDGGRSFEAWIHYTSLLVVQLWAVTTDIVPYSSAGKRVLGVIASAATLAALLFSILNRSFVEGLAVNPHRSLFGVCVALLLACALTWLSAAKSPALALASVPPGKRDGFGLLRHDPQVRRIAALAAIIGCVRGALAARVTLPTVDPWSSSGRWPLLGLLLIVQAGLLPLLLPRLTARKALLIAPLFVLLEMGLLSLLPQAQTILAVDFIEMLGSEWGSVAIVALFLAASRNARYDGQMVTALVAGRVGEVTGGILAEALTYVRAGSFLLTLAPLLLVAVWIWLALGAARQADDLGAVA